MPKVAIGISVGTEKFERPKWIETFKWACTRAMPGGSVTLEVCDTLQRHTLAITRLELIKLEAQLLQHPYKDDPENLEFQRLQHKIDAIKAELYETSRQAGQEWLERNVFPYLEEMREIAHSYRVTLNEDWHRWDQWLSHKEFDAYRQKVKQFDAEEPSFTEAMQQSISDAKERFAANRSETYPTPENTGFPEAILEQIISNHCHDYLAEECAGVMGTWQEAGYHTIAYPDKIIPVLATARRLLLSEENKVLLHWSKVGRIPQPPVQRFLNTFLTLAKPKTTITQEKDIPDRIREQLEECLGHFLTIWSEAKEETQSANMIDIPAFFLERFAELITSMQEHHEAPHDPALTGRSRSPAFGGGQ